jgi:hypothetical protein
MARLAVAAASVALLACAPNAAGAESPGALAQRLSTSESPSELTAATRSVLRASGVGVLDDAGARVTVRAASPAAGTDVLPATVAALAMGAGGAGGVTATDLAAMLRDTGLSPRRGATGAAVRGLLRDLAAGARQHRRSPVAFGPLFLEAMSDQRPRPPGVERRMTPLELQVLAATLQRAFARGDRRRARAAVDTPCSNLKRALGDELPWLGDGAELAAGEAVDKAGDWFGRALKHFTGLDLGDPRLAKPLGKLVATVTTAAKAAQLATFYQAASPRLTLDRKKVAKPEPASAPTQIAVAVSVGMDEQQRLDWEQEWGPSSAVRDCARSLGADVPKLGVEVLRDLESWRVRFRIDEHPAAAPGRARHVQWARFGTGAGQNPPPLREDRHTVLDYSLVKRGIYRGERALLLDVLAETHAEHGETRSRAGSATVHAEILAAEAPTLLDFLGGVAALPKFAIGWVQTFFAPRTSASTRVVWGHGPGCGEDESTQRGDDDGDVTLGFFRGSGLSGPPSGDSEEERLGAECSRFSIAFRVARDHIDSLSIKGLDWGCHAAREGDKRAPPRELRLPPIRQPGGHSAARLPHRDGRFRIAKVVEGTEAVTGKPFVSAFTLTGTLDDEKAWGTIVYSLRYVGLSGSNAFCTTGSAFWEAERT